MGVEGGSGHFEEGRNSVRVLNKDYPPSAESKPGKYRHIFTEKPEECGVIILPGFPGTAYQKNVGPWAQEYAEEWASTLQC